MKSPSNTAGIKAGDPNPWIGIHSWSSTVCMGQSLEGFRCTADQGHDGQHVATGFNIVYAVWTDK